jgi:hypothetical protein
MLILLELGCAECEFICHKKKAKCKESGILTSIQDTKSL